MPARVQEDAPHTQEVNSTGTLRRSSRIQKMAPAFRDDMGEEQLKIQADRDSTTWKDLPVKGWVASPSNSDYQGSLDESELSEPSSEDDLPPKNKIRRQRKANY
jgi:hypothetical protein